MSKGRELSDYLDDIITAIADTAEFTQGMSYEMFEADKKTAHAVIRCLEVLGEAADFYDIESPGLGTAFIDEVGRGIEIIRCFPEAAPLIH